MVKIFIEAISNVLNIYTPHETIICDDQDPPWINNKSNTREKSAFYKG